MSPFNETIATEQEADAMIELAEELKKFYSKVAQKVRFTVCILWNGKHDLYRSRSDTKLFQECVSCGYQTQGWTVDRRDRRLHLVKGNQK